MIYSTEVQHMCPVAKGAYHGPAPIPEEGKWVQAKEIKDISGFTHGVGWCAPQQGACKLTLNVKEGVIQEGGKHGAHLTAQTLAQILQGSAHSQSPLGERGLGAAIDNLEEQLPHGGIDGVAHQVGIQRLRTRTMRSSAMSS